MRRCSPSHQQDAQIFAEIAAETGVDEDPEAMEAGEEVVGGWEPIGDLAVVPSAPHTWREPIAPPPPTASPQTSQIVVGTKQPPIPRRSTVTHSRPNRRWCIRGRSRGPGLGEVRVRMDDLK